MPRAQLIIKRRPQAGFSVVEVLLAVTLFGFLSTALIGALVYGRATTADSGDQARASLLAEEGVEAVRNIRTAGYNNLGDGTYGLVQSGNTWTLSGTSDTTNIYTRSVTIASAGSNRKTVTGNVAWNGAAGSGAASVATELTNWMATVKSWAAPIQAGGANISNAAGFKVTTSGSYAYVVRNSATGPNFFVINISTPTAPTVVGTLTLAGTPTNIGIIGNYAYVSNTSDATELQSVNVATPTAPTLAGSYNAAGAGDGRGIYAYTNNAILLVRAANGGNDEFVIVNAANPASMARSGGYSSNVNMNEVYAYNGAAYIATSSDTLEVLVINISTPSLLSSGTGINLSGTGDATTIVGYNNTIILGQGASLYTISSQNSLSPVVSGNLTAPATINDTSLDPTHMYAFVGTNYANGELQVVNINNIASPALLSSVNLTGSVSLTGIAYNSTYDTALGVDSNTTQGVVVFAPN